MKHHLHIMSGLARLTWLNPIFARVTLKMITPRLRSFGFIFLIVQNSLNGQTDPIFQRRWYSISTTIKPITATTCYKMIGLLTRRVSGFSHSSQRTKRLMKPSSISCSFAASCAPFTMYRSFFRSNWVWAPSSQPKYLVGSEVLKKHSSHHNGLGFLQKGLNIQCTCTWIVTYKWRVSPMTWQCPPYLQSQSWYHFLYLQPTKWNFYHVHYQLPNNRIKIAMNTWSFGNFWCHGKNEQKYAISPSL